MLDAPWVYAPTTDYPIGWREVDAQLRPFLVDAYTQDERPALWAPQYGSQYAFLAATPIFEVLYAGTRGPGKTDALLMDFAKGVGKGWGSEWNGILFRRTYPELADVIKKSKHWFPLLFPGANYNKSAHEWDFPTGEKLAFRHMRTADDYWAYHGHAYPWQGWEELTNWPDDKCFTVMQSCCRSTVPGMPRCVRATANPYGVGHNWVKARYRLPQGFGRVIMDSVRAGELEPPRVAIHGQLSENRILLHSDPEYLQRITAAARNDSELRAWVHGDWDIVAGGMFDDLWRGNVHVVPDIPMHRIPKGWRLDRSFDWGSSKPFAVCWWAESNGEPLRIDGRVYGAVRGDLYMIQEWYGCTSQPNEGLRMLARDVAQGIRDREDDWGIRQRVHAGPADSAIYTVENGNDVSRDMKLVGVRWLPADKAPGSRKNGWEMVRRMMSDAIPPQSGPRENPGLFICASCEAAQRCLPGLPRDDRDLDDVDTEAEDHIGDAVRYRVRHKVRSIRQS